MPLHLAFNDLDALRERCETATVRTAKQDPAYEEGSVVPSGLWQPLTEADGLSLAVRSGTSAAMLVEIVRPPAPSKGDLEHLARPLGDDEAQYLGQALSKPHSVTTTENYQDGRLIGLHLDNWDKLIYKQKPRGRRRLALNLGPGTRYMLVGTLDAQAVCRAVHPEDYTHRYPSTDDYRKHVAAGQPVRVHRIRLAPGEGYIAPTEYLLHDGSTEGQDHPSAAAFWLGRWAAGTLPSLV
ncbi:hypothetical protein GCM10010232_42560 [Streptomyces amakusaensis]|uniref:Uncharacterized protein n=1 Tax=Streptomyces amakusaensis TaxID=67271 RepID=A0ABW0AGV3_9ACTN